MVAARPKILTRKMNMQQSGGGIDSNKIRSDRSQQHLCMKCRSEVYRLSVRGVGGAAADSGLSNSVLALARRRRRR